jgi:hypothetical protein
MKQGRTIVGFLPENAARKKKCAEPGFTKDNLQFQAGGPFRMKILLKLIAWLFFLTN